MIEDGATLQLGIGSIPDAVMECLGNHKSLGVHSEMFSNGVMDLMKKGILTNEFKKKHKGKKNSVIQRRRAAVGEHRGNLFTSCVHAISDSFLG